MAKLAGQDDRRGGAQVALGDSGWTLSAYESALGEQADKGNQGELMRLLPVYVKFLRSRSAQASTTEWSRLLADHLGPLVGKLAARQDYELAFALTTGAECCHEIPESSRKQLALSKAGVALRISGLIPVPPTDPTYDLHAASRAHCVGNEAQAWDLTQLKLKLLPAAWQALPPAYVAWTVDQMRKQRLLKPALNLAMTVLLREKELDPEIAARVSLAKGEIYMDMENYQAARLEFESLRNDPIYAKTEAGVQATNRLVNLMIVTKDYTGAEGLLARMVDSDRVQAQADGYYFYAKLAYLQGDYKEAAANLRKVKDRVANHLEAALLQGEVNLRLPGGLQYTEIEIGDPKLSTFVIPGQVLTLKLIDPNLSVVRGAASVPVVIKTSKGGDDEHVNLLPTSADKGLFVGTLPTMLAKVQKGNQTLELRGDDRVTYEIEESFQKANGLNYPPKAMEVRYDARLMASSGEILTEADQEKLEMERRLQQVRPAEGVHRFERERNTATIRPGGNIFVQVIDLAADAGDMSGKVKIALKTSSGDLLEDFELAETGPHTGIFRARCPPRFRGPRPRPPTPRKAAAWAESSIRPRPCPGSAWLTARSRSGWKSIP